MPSELPPELPTMAETPSKKAPANRTTKAANGKKRSKKRIKSTAARKKEYVTLDYYSSLFFNRPIGFKIPINYSGNYPVGLHTKSRTQAWPIYTDVLC